MNKKIERIFEYLEKEFPNPQFELSFKNNFEMLCAVILSAQCTDKRVNLITPNLFEKYPSPQKMAEAKLEDVENIIKSCGFYHNKAKSLVEMSKTLCEKFDGKVPNNFDDLISLKGVGRKTANVVLAGVFGQNEIGVDTHIFRISHRLNLSNGSTPSKVEMDLRKLFKGNRLAQSHIVLVLFGRYICKAQKPICEKCELKDLCSFYKNRQKSLKNKIN